LLDVTPLTLRLGTVGGYTEAIIEKNTPIPIDRTRTFTTARNNQDRVVIKIYQGESRRTDECTLLGQFEFTGIRTAPRGEVKIEVTFEIDTDGIVNVSARDVDTGQEASTTISLSSGLSENDIQQSIERQERIQVIDRPPSAESGDTAMLPSQDMGDSPTDMRPAVDADTAIFKPED